MGYDREQDQIYRKKDRLIDKELGPRYRTDEARQGESYRDFKKRIISEDLKSINEKARLVYPAWIQAPGESNEDFRKRLTSINPDSPPKYPAWKKAPNETEEQFKKRFTAKSG